MDKRQKILDFITRDARISAAQMAAMLDMDESEVRRAIKGFEDDNVIVKYKAMVNPQKVENGNVTALIEIKVIPERGTGFDSVSERIAKFPEVKSLFLLSGTYDLLAIAEGKNLQEVSAFVSQKLATIERVQSTTTHFLLKKYKEDGIEFFEQDRTRRLQITP
jgi:DNA-binding Lrp family transcriptional regulator